MPVNTGAPVRGFSRWWAGRPSASIQLRREIPLVATAPLDTPTLSSGEAPNGAAT